MRFPAVMALVLLPVTGQAATVQYTIGLHDRVAEVRAKFPEDAEESVTFALQSWAGCDFYGDIERLAASDLHGNPLPIEPKPDGEWVVQIHRQPFQLTWRVRATKDAMVGSELSSQFHATLLKDWVLIWGHAFLLTPIRSPLSRAPVTVRMETNEYGRWDSTLPAGRKLPHLEDLTDQLFIAGNFRSYRRAGRKYYFATSQAAVPDRDLMQAVDKIFGAQTRYMGKSPSRPPLFVFTDSRPMFNGGTVVQNSAVLYPDLSLGLESRNWAVLRLIAHELFHLWNGGQIKPRDDAEWPDGKYGWFAEGFTEYYAGATLYREGIMHEEGFATFLNNLIVDYTQNGESLRATIEDLGSKQWRDHDHQSLPYTKGALLGLLMDLQLRKKGRTLDDYMRAMLLKQDYDMSDLRASWVALAGETGAEFWDHFIPTADPLPFAEGFRSAGIRFEERDTPIFDLGFTIDKANIEKDAKVVTVEKGSNAEKAGIRMGDSLLGFSVYHGDTGKEAKFGLSRGSERVDVAYLPVTTRTVVQITGGLGVLRRNAKTSQGFSLRSSRSLRFNSHLGLNIYVVGDTRTYSAAHYLFPAGTFCLSSSNQFWTRIISVTGVGFLCSSLTMRNRCPSWDRS
jgi:predicted metalloprotease with PDZ domain